MGRRDEELSDYVTERMAAATGGRKEALYDLGLLYSTGQGVDQDFIAAHKWFNLAAISGIRRAAVDRAELAQDMSRGQIEEAQRLARQWIETH